jgi:hypothetical protein
MKFFTFSQNNSGGRFTGPAQYVVVQADDTDDANDIAQDNGVYFNGCSKGWDCDCCGDRWYACDDSDGDDSPSIHNTPVADYRSRYGADGHPTAAVVYKDGTTVTHP